MSLAVANQYAIALLDSSARPGSGLEAAAALEQVQSFAAALKASPGLRAVMLSPAVSFAQKRKLMTRLASVMSLHPLTANFLLVAARNRRLPLLPAIAERMQALMDERAGIVRARVASAQPLDEQRRKLLETALTARLGKPAQCVYESDPALIGGVAVRVGSSVFDGSVRGQLEALRRRLGSEV